VRAAISAICIHDSGVMAPGQVAWGSSGKEARFLTKFRRLLGRIDEEDRRLLLYMAQKMVRR